MDARKAKPMPQTETDWGEDDVTAADIAACDEAEAAVARGEWVDGDVVMAKLDAMIRKFQEKATKQR
jgi:hypothetical protein